MARSALCVGINEFQSLSTNSWLSGCVNDANDMAAALKKFGFTSRSTTVLLDADATKKNVMAALTSMVEKAKPGDHLVFTYSSHGTQVPNVASAGAKADDEYDDLDEAFACYDIRAGANGWDRDTVIVDDELRELFARVPDGVLLEVLLDTCHSGSGLRDLDDVMQDLLRGRRPRYLPPPTPKDLAKAREIRAAAPRTVERRPLVELTKSRRAGAKPVLFAACRPEQTASDAQFGGRPNGAFTYLFLKALKDNPASTRSQLHAAVTAGLKKEDFEQRATLEGPRASRSAVFGSLW
jgi:uncharacterized caspase-like protein